MARRTATCNAPSSPPVQRERTALPSASGAPAFDYGAAFSRTLGWLTEWEQQMLRDRTVAIAGLGGVGGAHALTLARLGIGRFHLADFDRFDLANMNRQAGAFMSTLGRDKLSVVAGMVGEINPEARITRFAEGVRDDNLDSFLDGVDLLVDGLDFFVLDVRRALFAKAHKRGIPAITLAPLGHGVGWLSFLPGGMSFEEYFRLEGEPVERQYVKFMVGLAPKGLHRRALVDPGRVDFAAKAGPSTPMACQMASAILGTEAVKILLRRGRVEPAPVFHQFDPYRGLYRKGRHRGGNAHPLRRLQIAVAARWIARIARPRPAGEEERLSPDAPVLDRILDIARWAPSGDNDQPWRFERIGPLHVRVHVQHEAGANVYEYADGRPVWLAVGALLETMRIAAADHGLQCRWQALTQDRNCIDVVFSPAQGLEPDPLAPFITIRSVDRTAYRRWPLGEAEKRALAAAWGPEFDICWHTAPAERWMATRLNMAATRLRLAIRECHRVHERVIRFGSEQTSEGIPAAAVGLDPLTVRLMRWANARWWRTRLLNRYLGGGALAALQLDLLPGLSCAAHLTVRWRDGRRPRRIADWIAAGQRLQRFWLTATRHGLTVQPSFAPIIFAHHARHGGQCWEWHRTQEKAERIANLADRVHGPASEETVFAGRIGTPRRRIGPRSTRLPLARLWLERG
ncbi:MAG: thiamine biosynthesis protein ThiF [Alphaproteobacteria bacterium]|nr:MAG: thiamine biosynthesis protein ThiF [Alphaproteobacteria bacterium]